MREWDSNGTVFGYNKSLGKVGDPPRSLAPGLTGRRVQTFMAGEFGHNDFYPVVIAACEMKVTRTRRACSDGASQGAHSTLTALPRHAPWSCWMRSAAASARSSV